MEPGVIGRSSADVHMYILCIRRVLYRDGRSTTSVVGWYSSDISDSDAMGVEL